MNLTSGELARRTDSRLRARLAAKVGAASPSPKPVQGGFRASGTAASGAAGGVIGPQTPERNWGAGWLSMAVTVAREYFWEYFS
jgi:hypothetical protein